MSDDPPDPRVAASNRQDVPIDERGLIALARHTLVSEGRTGDELSISFVGEQEMADLHERYLDEPGPTDVLSFPQGEQDLLGDVVVCPAFAAKQAGDLAAELRLLVVHGILHLLGYEHYADEARAEMWARQELYSGVRVPMEDPDAREVTA